MIDNIRLLHISVQFFLFGALYPVCRTAGWHEMRFITRRHQLKRTDRRCKTLTKTVATCMVRQSNNENEPSLQNRKSLSVDEEGS